MRPGLCLLLLAVSATSTQLSQPQRQGEMRAIIGSTSGRAEVLNSVDALPAHIATAFRDPLAFTQSAAGEYLVFDRRAQTVYSIDKARAHATRLLQLGPERGRLLRPTAFASEPDGGFLVADVPAGAARIQRFADRGYLLNGFTLSGAPGSRTVSLPGFVGGGITSLQSTGDSIFLSRPETGSLIEEYSWNGQMRRAFGELRATGQEGDSAVRLALNVGIPLVDPTGGFYFVFQAGVPVFRRYDGSGRLVFERHIEGRELDQALATQPTVWPKRRTGEGTEVPAVPMLVRTAAVDPRGNLWVALAESTLYVYSPDGDKLRTLRLRAAGPLAPSGLYFAGPSRLLVTPGCYIFDVSGIGR